MVSLSRVSVLQGVLLRVSGGYIEVYGQQIKRPPPFITFKPKRAPFIFYSWARGLAPLNKP